MKIIETFNRFIEKSGFVFNKNETSFYEKFAGKDADGNHLCVPLILAKGNNEIRVVGFEGFYQNFSDVTSLIANPGQGKSRLSTAIYNIMRGTDECYFRESESATSFTKGVWRLSDYHKQKHLSKDKIDILDVEGLQKENSIYYLLIAVIVLSKSMVLLSRERVNKEALGVLEIAFKMLNRLGIALNKPVLFIQTKIGRDGHFKDSNDSSVSEAELLESIAKDIPVIRDFRVEFFRLREVPDIEVLLDSGLDYETATMTFQKATDLYFTDVKALLNRLANVKDAVTSECRMDYLNRVLDHLNNNNPDLVLEQNLEFFQKDAELWLRAAVCREKKDLVEKHLHKPVGNARTLKEFFEPPDQDLRATFFQYCEKESPFLGKESDKGAYEKVAREVFENSQYAKVLQTKDQNGDIIGIMSYALSSFEAKRITSENILIDIFNRLKNELDESGFDMFISDPPPESARCVRCCYF